MSPGSPVAGLLTAEHPRVVADYADDVTHDASNRPILPLALTGSSPARTPPAPSRHETILPPEPPDALAAVDAAWGDPNASHRRAALLAAAAAHPALLEVWARLSELSLSDGDSVAAYAFARVAYHRGLDRLRREGWGGTGLVHWSEPSNRGFLRGVHALLGAAAALGEEDESSRCRAFLLDLDPDDALGVATYPEVPGRAWSPPIIP